MRQGNEIAFTELYRFFGGKLYAFAYRFLASDDLAQEIVHDVFVIVWERREQLDPHKSFESYLFTIAKHKALDLIKGYAKEVELNIDYCDMLKQNHDIDYSFTFQEIKKLEKETVERFPTQRKLVYKLSREEYLSYDEIALRLGISKNSVKTHLKLALKELREKIAPVTNISLSLIFFLEIYF